MSFRREEPRVARIRTPEEQEAVRERQRKFRESDLYRRMKAGEVTMSGRPIRPGMPRY